MKRPIRILLYTVLALTGATAQAVTCHNGIPPSNPDIVYGNNGDGTVTDLHSGLMWKRCAQGQSGTACSGTAATMAWADAQAAAQASTFAGYSDWRLPSFRELESLVEDCRSQPAINGAYFPNTGSSIFWSGSPYPQYPNYAWGMSFNYGNGYSNVRSSLYRVRLVRGGQSFGDLIFEDGFENGS